MDSVSEWLNIQFGSRRRLAFALGGAMMLGAVVAPSIAHFLATDESSPEQVKKNGFRVRRSSLSLEVEEDARTVVYQPDNGDTAIIWIDSSAPAADAVKPALVDTTAVEPKLHLMVVERRQPVTSMPNFHDFGQT